jgi:hypothetical protein
MARRRARQDEGDHLGNVVCGDFGEALAVIADEGLTIITYTVEPASVSSEALRLLASWATTTRESPAPA